MKECKCLLNLEHLHYQTNGDKTLEQEVLTLFVLQSANIIKEFENNTDNINDLLHKLKGSSLAIGAGSIVQKIEKIETAGISVQALIALIFQVRATNVAIKSYLN